MLLRDDLNYSFNPRLSVKDFSKLLSVSLQKARFAEKKINCQTNLCYGKTSLQKLDVFYKYKKKNLPIHIFIHGGYWRALDKSYHSHMALPFIKNNICFFNINYELCPKVKLTDIKNQIIKAILWIHKNAKKFGGDNNNIVLSGHSAGAHLVSMMLSVNWIKYNINPNIFKGIALISGIYNTEIVPDLKVNDEIRLSNIEAIRNNPFRLKPKLNTKAIISYGNKEPLLWQKQSKKFLKFLNNNNFQCKEIISKNDNHFSLIDTLGNFNNKLVKEIISLSLN